jgi:hypothetical protein
MNPKQPKLSVNNNLKNTEIGGDYVGQQTVNHHYDIKEIAGLWDKEAVEVFSVNAAGHITVLAQEIIESATDEDEALDFGLLAADLKQKFLDMKCTETYQVHFNQAAAFFPVVDELVRTDVIGRKRKSIRSICSYIAKIYMKMLDKYSTGDEIHASIHGQLCIKLNAENEHRAAEVLIAYTINECGIFNEKK